MSENQKKYFEIIKKLLPKSRLWKLIDTKYLQSFFKALSSLPADLRKFLDNIYFDIFPKTTRAIEKWEEEYGIINQETNEELRRKRIEARWNDKGGQSAYYLQKILQENGFDVLVHENNPVANPNDFLDNNDDENEVIINGITRITEEKDLMIRCENSIIKDYSIECSKYNSYTCAEENVVCGYFEEYHQDKQTWHCADDRAVCGYFESYIELDSEEDIPTNSAYFPFLFFIGGEAVRDENGKIIELKAAKISSSRLAYFRQLVLSIKPAQSWAIVRVIT